MRFLCVLKHALIAALVAALIASPAVALDAHTQQDDAGAGPISVRPTVCLMANQTHRGEPCVEPQVSESGAKAEQVAGRLDRAWYFIDMQDLEKARAEADLALAVSPDNVTARHLSARISLTMLDLPRAEADLWLALKQAPDDADIQTTHAVFLQLNKVNAQALRELNEVITRHPDHLYAREQAANVCMTLGYHELALANLNFVLERRETTALLAERAAVFMALDRPQSAVADLSSALKREPERTDLVKARAEAPRGSRFR
jgi:predicted Zn-dependent protease